MSSIDVPTAALSGDSAESMDEHPLVSVSPRHSVRLAKEYAVLLERAPSKDYVVHTISNQHANGLPLMTAEIVIAGRETRDEYPRAATYPLHFRKRYFPARMHADTAAEFASQELAAGLLGAPPPIGHSPGIFRSCLIPGQPYQRLTPFGGQPEERNLSVARELQLSAAAGLWRLQEEAYDRLCRLHAGGLSHGDTELHNLIVCPAPLELAIIDFELAVRKAAVDSETWTARLTADLGPILREAVFLQCALGRQSGALADAACAAMGILFKAPERFRREIDDRAYLSR